MKQKDVEIEIKVKVEKIKPLIKFLLKNGEIINTKIISHDNPSNLPKSPSEITHPTQSLLSCFSCDLLLYC
ncbi:MAG: hypothetical protein ACHQUA_02710, partial [Microgenomates group bacterium]